MPITAKTLVGDSDSPANLICDGTVYMDRQHNIWVFCTQCSPFCPAYDTVYRYRKRAVSVAVADQPTFSTVSYAGQHVRVSTTHSPVGKTDRQHPEQTPALHHEDGKLYAYDKAEQSADLAAEIVPMTYSTK